MAAILAHEKVAPLLSDDHFSVDGTLVEAWASFKSFKPKAADVRRAAARCRSAAACCDEMARDDTGVRHGGDRSRRAR